MLTLLRYNSSKVWKYREKFGQLIGLGGSVIVGGIFINSPSFPTPDKIIVFVFFFMMIFKQAFFVLKRLLPFVAILLVYDSFRGVADELNSQVNYTFMIGADQFLFGELPTLSLQQWLWHGHVQWIDFVVYIPYMLHFVLPVSMAIVLWETRRKYYWDYVTAFSVVSFAAFFTYLLFPAAPPWLAAELGYIESIQRISSDVWFSLGITDFPSVYNHISPNPVAAVPSLHAAWAVLLFIYVFRLYGRRWGLLALLYPLLIIFGTIYQGEHYAFDAFAGVFYALAAYFCAPYIVRFINRRIAPLLHRHHLAKAHAKRQMGLKK